LNDIGIIKKILMAHTTTSLHQTSPYKAVLEASNHPLSTSVVDVLNKEVVGFEELIFSPLLFSLFPLSKYKGVIYFFFNLILVLLFLFVLFFYIILINFFYFVPYHFILYNLYIKFDHRFFYCYFFNHFFD
jgi:hypothetical protein